MSRRGRAKNERLQRRQTDAEASKKPGRSALSPFQFPDDVTQFQYRGPIPPDWMAKYYETDPKIVDHFLDMAEKYGEHGRKEEQFQNRAQAFSVILGQILIWSILAACLVFGYLLIQGGKDAGWILSVLSIAAALLHALRGLVRKND
jgi:hypothetical protein